MSKIGKKPITIPEGVNIKIDGQLFSVTSADKTLEVKLPREIKIEQKDGLIIIDRINETIIAKSLHGLYNRLVFNAIEGVKNGFTKELTFTGTGYRASTTGTEMILNMGYSHDVKLPIPLGIEAKIVKNTITITGMDKQSVGQFAAVVRAVRPPEVYKGKGIKYKDEFIKRKAGKTAASK